MTKQETYDYLRARGAAFEITEHKAVYNMEECADLELPYPESDAKNLFVRDDKQRSYYLITVRGDKHVDLKAFRRAHGRARSASPRPKSCSNTSTSRPAPSRRWGCCRTRRAACSSSSTRSFCCRRGGSASTRTTTPPPSGCGRTICCASSANTARPWS